MLKIKEKWGWKSHRDGVIDRHIHRQTRLASSGYFKIVINQRTVRSVPTYICRNGNYVIEEQRDYECHQIMNVIIIWLISSVSMLENEKQRELWWIGYYSLVCEYLSSCSEWGWICGLWIREARLEIPLGENNNLDPVDWHHRFTTVCGKKL